MSNSPLVNYTKISPNKTVGRTHAIDTITIHCVVGQVTVKSLGAHFSDPSLDASSNYGVGTDGQIGMYVEEKDRSWCSSNAANDNRAITIEVASDTKPPYAVNAAAYKGLIDLLVDICMRNNIKELKWKGDKSLIGKVDKQNMTAHRWFAPTECPGDYLYERFGQIAAEVNARLGKIEIVDPVPETKPIEPATTMFKEGDLVSLTKDAKYYNGKIIPQWVINEKWYVKSASGDRVVIDKSEDGKNAINSPVNAKYLTMAKSTSNLPYMVRVSIDDLNIRKGPGTNYGKNGFTGKGVFTITEVKTGTGSKAGWGKLKSNAGWISLDYAKRV